MGLRLDARENRDRIVDAAGELFARDGLDVPMSDVARRAGVGAATLSRRFPTRQSLIDAVFERQLGWWMDAIASVEAAEDSWSALTGLLEQACVEQARDEVCADLVVRAFFRGDAFESEKVVLRATVERIIDRATTAGSAHADIGWDDIVLLMEANAGAGGLGRPDPEAASRRLAQHFIRSFSLPLRAS